MIDLIYQIGGMIFSGCIGYFWGRIDGEDFYEKKAIEENVAVWTIDPKTGERKFQFITKEEGTL